jgi:enamidase
MLVERRLPINPTLAVMERVIPKPVMQRVQTRVREFSAAGGRVTVGTEAGMPGVPFGSSVHRELELLVDSGLTPRSALRGATRELPKYWGPAPSEPLLRAEQPTCWWCQGTH